MVKQTSSAFYGQPDRHACHTFDRLGPSGDLMTADELTQATLTSLHGEFATVVQTADLLAA